MTREDQEETRMRQFLESVLRPDIVEEQMDRPMPILGGETPRQMARALRTDAVINAWLTVLGWEPLG